MKDKCTWKDCKNIGIYPHFDFDGHQYAFLCLTHENTLDEAIDSYGRTKDNIKFQTLLKHLLVDAVEGSIKTGIKQQDNNNER